jgi:antitoxin component of MazEF toxin-antitoxin module
MVTRKITTSGNSAVITLSPDILGFLGVDVGDTVVLELRGHELTVRPLTEDNRSRRFQDVKRRVVAKRTGLLKRLAAADADKKP